jgi:hypothetical protein
LEAASRESGATRSHEWADDRSLAHQTSEAGLIVERVLTWTGDELLRRTSCACMGKLGRQGLPEAEFENSGNKLDSCLPWRQNVNWCEVCTIRQTYGSHIIGQKVFGSKYDEGIKVPIAIFVCAPRMHRLTTF